MKVVTTRAELREARGTLGDSVGLVLTMGALHEGHLSLVRHARADNAAVIATIFVNPAQFGPSEDLTAYPRTLDNDLALLNAEGVDLVFAPPVDEVYPPGFQTHVEVEEVAQGLEGARRPGHFRGVATVVTKLFNLTQPRLAYFGQKDAQQVVVIRRMVADLNQPVEIAVIPTVREADGLALSSRNRYLTPSGRTAAVVLSNALKTAGELYESGERRPDVLRGTMHYLLASEPLAQVDYVSVADPCTLHEADAPSESPLLASLTVQIGKPRLLDNMLLPLHLNDRDGLTAILGAV